VSTKPTNTQQLAAVTAWCESNQVEPIYVEVDNGFARVKLMPQVFNAHFGAKLCRLVDVHEVGGAFTGRVSHTTARIEFWTQRKLTDGEVAARASGGRVA
jgi:hypothetical protein